jgi:hypothetical protein
MVTDEQQAYSVQPEMPGIVTRLVIVNRARMTLLEEARFARIRTQLYFGEGIGAWYRCGYVNRRLGRRRAMSGTRSEHIRNNTQP